MTEAISQAVVEKAKALVLVTRGKTDGKVPILNSYFALEATRHRMGPSLRQQVFNWTAKDKYLELENINGSNIYFQLGIMA